MNLDWEGCWNVRDLGGIPCKDGKNISLNSGVRSDDPCKLSSDGWAALSRHGIRTIISLQTKGMERKDLDLSPRPKNITTFNIAIEDCSDSEFLKKYIETSLWNTPLYYSFALKNWPNFYASVMSTIANAQPGGILVHCGEGRDRTGLVTLLLLSLVGVSSKNIINDYLITYENMRKSKKIEEYNKIMTLIDQENASLEKVLAQLLSSFDAKAYLLKAGLDSQDLDAILRLLID